MQDLQRQFSNNNYNNTSMGVFKCDKGANQKGSQWPDLGKFEQENKVILNYDPKYEITIRRVHIDINK